MDFNNLYTAFIKAKTPLLKEGTLRNYNVYYRLYFAPAFGATDLSDITKDTMAVQFAAWRNSCAPTLLPNLKKSLHAICAHGAELDKWAKNPVTGIKVQKIVPTNVKILSDKQIKILLDCCKSSPYYPELLTLVMTGMRSAELRGLQWQDIDFIQNTITIRRTFDKGKIGDTKTATSRRIIDAPQRLIACLKKHKDKRKSKWVFVGTKGQPISSSSTLLDHMRKCLEMAGLPNVRAHSFRHSHISHLLESKRSLKAIEKRTGLSSATVLMYYYAHVSAAERGKVIRSLDVYFDKRRKKRYNKPKSLRRKPHGLKL